jgi:hypothetical protein
MQLLENILAEEMLSGRLENGDTSVVNIREDKSSSGYSPSRIISQILHQIYSHQLVSK